MFKKQLGLSLLLAASLGLASASIQGEALADATMTHPELTATKIAEQVQKFYDASTTFRAKFKQRYTIEAHRKEKNSEGTVVFQKPGKMSWRYVDSPNRVVSDGKVIKVYEGNSAQPGQPGQMFEQPIDKSQYPAALSFLLGGGSLLKEFTLTRLSEKDFKIEGAFVLAGVPKTKTPAYQKILLFVDANTYQVRRVIMIDAQRNRNRFDFDEPTVNQPVDQKEFQFTPPAGTKVIKP